ncbi:MAG: hypothetical protein IJ027_07450 [Oscillospiraceae bacterium]|nr:hypothetical protein [Oscillospiraceae bacterium]
MFKRSMDEEYIFMTRTFWLEMNIPLKFVNQKYKGYFGADKKVIEDRKEAIKILSSIIGQMQSQFVNWLKSENPNAVIKDLYKVLDECFNFYIKQKAARKKLVELNVSDDSIVEVFVRNRNMAQSVIDSVNLWIENCLLFQEAIEKPYDNKSFEINQELFIDLYIYGTVSKALSLLNLSKKFGEKNLYYGISITPDNEEPIEILKYHPVIHFNTLLMGNQDAFQVSINEYKNASASEFGKGFKDEYGVDFILALRTMSTLQADMLHDGKYAYTVIDKNQFIQWINKYTGGQVDGNWFFEAFTLTKNNICSQLKENDPIVWIMSVNKYRHEIRPFVCLENERIAISNMAIEQAKHLWLSYFANGGMIYSNCSDNLTIAIEKRNEELSEKLVAMLRDKLRSHYEAGFDEIDVQYDRIFEERDYNYGDYDLVFYAKDVNELFLIEAKFFSDSFSNSGIITDYEKMFKKKGYYEHCRKRYDLVLSEPDKIKQFIGIPGDVNVHFLFVSSKPLEFEFTDQDGIVTFPCLSNFDDYLEGKLLPEIGDIPVRSTHRI